MDDKNLADPFQAQYEARQRPLDKVARLDAPEPWRWNGEASVRLSNRTVVGPTSLGVNGSAIIGKIAWRSTEPAIVDFLSNYNPGRLVSMDNVGAARPNPDDGSWSAEGVRDGTTHYSSSSGTSSDFVAHKVKLRGEGKHPAIHRFLVRGIQMATWPQATYFRGEHGYYFSVDALETAIYGRPAIIRQIVKSDKQEDQIVGFIVQGIPLNESEESLALLLVEFLAGSRSQVFVQDSFDEDCQLVDRTWYGVLHPQFTKRVDEPIDDNSLRALKSDTVRDMLLNLQEKDRLGLPITTAIHHLTDACTSNLTTDIFFLTLSIHTLFEGHAKVTDSTRFITSSSEYRRRINSLVEQVGVVFPNDNSGIVESLKAKISAGNRIDAAVLRDNFFRSIGLSLTPFEIAALNERNHLFHNGYLKRRHGLTEEEIFQLHYDESCALRNLANRAILRLLNYEGNVQDSLTYRSQSIYKGATARIQSGPTSRA